MTTARDWATGFETELVRLGLQPGRARRLREETTAQAEETGAAPGTLFGPVHLARYPEPSSVPGR